MTFFSVFWGGLVGAIQAWQWNAWSAVAAFALGVTLFSLLGMAFLLLAPWMWRLRWVIAAWVVLCGIGAVVTGFVPATDATSQPLPDKRVVQLWSTPLPEGLGCIADHHWLLAFDPGTKTWHRWEVMERTHLGGTNWGYVYQDCYKPYHTFGGGPPSLMMTWKGTTADRLAEVLDRAADYPLRERYLAWPGPNCNTFAAWVLREAGVSSDMGPKSLGENYLGPVAGAGWTPGGTGVHLESSSAGVRAGWREGVELHLCAFVFGVDVWTPGVKTPFGRFGFPEN